MKKVVFILITLLAFSINVKADTISTSMTGVSNIDAKGSFSITINVNGTDVWGMTMGLNYDTNKLELISSEGQNGFTATVGNNIVLDSTSGHSGNFKVIILTFKAKDSFLAGQSTTISLSNVQGSSASAIMSGTGSSKTITVNIPKSSNNNLSNLKVDGSTIVDFNKSVTSYDLGNTTSTSITIEATKEDSKASISGLGIKTLDYGTNSFDIVVTAENGTKKTYTIKITRPDTRSTDNTLTSLSASPLDLGFGKNKTSYVFTVENNISSINIVAKANDSKASVTGTGTKTLNDYANVFYVTVTAENGSKKTYTITVNRKDKDGNLGNLSNDNNLKELIIEGFELQFSSDKTNYTIEIDNSIDNVVINASANDEKASVSINNIEQLKVGNNTIIIDVTAENGSVKTYTINVIRKDNVPITTLDKLEETLNTTEKDQVIVEIKDNNSILTTKMLTSIKDSKKEVVINKYDDDNNIIYSWVIDGKKVTDTKSINTNIKFNSDNFDAISELTNYADAVYLNFEHSGDLPENTKVKVYVGERYKNGDLVNIYYFDEKDNKMENIEMEIEVKDGYVEFVLEHCSEYIITRSEIQTNGINVFMIITIIETILLIGLGLLLFIILKKNNFKLKEILK